MDENTIINKMLSAIGEGGMNYANSSHPSVQAAKRILTLTDIEFQSEGWWFNTEYALKLLPDTDGKVAAPADALDVRLAYVGSLTPREKLRYVRRGGFIYDTYLHTNVINDPVYVDYVLRLSITDMPPIASIYLMHKAVEQMYLDDDGEATKLRKLEQNRLEAWTKFKATNLRILRVSALDSPVALRLRMGMYQSSGAYNPTYPGGRQR